MYVAYMITEVAVGVVAVVVVVLFSDVVVVDGGLIEAAAASSGRFGGTIIAASLMKKDWMVRTFAASYVPRKYLFGHELELGEAR
jgi:hypothetical protein